MGRRPPRRGPLRLRIELGLAAFAPAFGLIAARSGGQWWSWAFLSLAALGVLVLLWGVVLVRNGNAESFGLDDIDDASDEVVGHIGAYIVPVVIDTSASPLNAAIGAAALLLVVQIHIATGRVHINPLLYLFGYRVHTASTGASAYYLLARSDVADWSEFHPLVDVGSSVLVEPWKGRK